MVFAGYTEGNWSVNNVGGQDFVAIGVVASFSETPMIVSSTGGSPGSDEGSNTAKGFIIMAFITVCLLVAAFCCYRAGRREESQLSERRGAENGCLSWWQRQRRAWAEA